MTFVIFIFILFIQNKNSSKLRNPMFTGQWMFTSLVLVAVSLTLLGMVKKRGVRIFSIILLISVVVVNLVFYSFETDLGYTQSVLGNLNVGRPVVTTSTQGRRTKTIGTGGWKEKK
jgi:hypothetical protein